MMGLKQLVQDAETTFNEGYGQCFGSYWNGADSYCYLGAAAKQWFPKVKEDMLRLDTTIFIDHYNIDKSIFTDIAHANDAGLSWKGISAALKENFPEEFK